MFSIKTNLILLLSFLSLFTQKLQAQTIHDAIELRSFVDSNVFSDQYNEAKLYKMLANSCSNLGDNPSYASIKKAYLDNPFLKSMFGNLKASSTSVVSIQDNRGFGNLNNAVSGISIPATTILMGLTDFLVKRTKQELSIAFFKDFQEAIKESQELKLLFPATAKALANIGNEIYQFKAFWEVLKAAFIKDLQNMLPNLGHYVSKSTSIEDPVTKYLIGDFIKVTEMFQDNKTPANILHYLAEDAYLHSLELSPTTDSFGSALQSCLKIIGIISASLEQKDKNGYWVAPELFGRVLKDATTTKLYLGLMYQQCKDVSLHGQTLANYLHQFSDSENGLKTKQFIEHLRRFLDKSKALKRFADAIRLKQQELRKNKNKVLTEAENQALFDNYFQFTDAVCDLVLNGYEMYHLMQNNSDSITTIIRTYLYIIKDINTIALNIQQKQYVNAFMHALFSLDKILPANKFECQRKQLLKFGSFVATVVKAQNTEEVSDAIEAFALPPGSAAIKKNARFSIALNAYVGLATGQERLEGLGPKPFYAVTTPIGFSFSWGFEKFGAFSILASLIDIGALTAYRFEDNNVQELPDLKFENVLAPGAYLIYDIPKYPMSIGLGGQLGPNLRSVTNGTLGLTNTNGWRWGAFIAVDIPMISVYNSNKSYRKCPQCPNNKKNLSNEN